MSARGMRLPEREMQPLLEFNDGVADIAVSISCGGRRLELVSRPRRPAMQEAVAIRCELAETNPDRYRPHLERGAWDRDPTGRLEGASGDAFVLVPRSFLSPFGRLPGGLLGLDGLADQRIGLGVFTVAAQCVLPIGTAGQNPAVRRKPPGVDRPCGRLASWPGLDPPFCKKLGVERVTDAAVDLLDASLAYVGNFLCRERRTRLKPRNLRSGEGPGPHQAYRDAGDQRSGQISLCGAIVDHHLAQDVERPYRPSTAAFHIRRAARPPRPAEKTGLRADVMISSFVAHDASEGLSPDGCGTGSR